MGYEINNKQSKFLSRFSRGFAVRTREAAEVFKRVLGPQAILRPMQVVLHEYGSLANWHMQANLHNTQANLHNVFATRVDSQCRLQFFCS